MFPVVTVLAGLAIVVGLAGIIIPVLPGTGLIWVAVAVWALVAQDPVGWWTLFVATGLLAVGWVLQYLIPGRRLKSAGVPGRTTLAGLLAGIVLFFLIPVVGLVIGFVGGIFLAELIRLREVKLAWPSSVHAMKAALVSYGIELATGLAMAAAFVVGVWRLAV